MCCPCMLEFQTYQRGMKYNFKHLQAIEINVTIDAIARNLLGIEKIQEKEREGP